MDLCLEFRKKRGIISRNVFKKSRKTVIVHLVIFTNKDINSFLTRHEMKTLNLYLYLH